MEIEKCPRSLFGVFSESAQLQIFTKFLQRTLNSPILWQLIGLAINGIFFFHRNARWPQLYANKHITNFGHHQSKLTKRKRNNNLDNNKALHISVMYIIHCTYIFISFFFSIKVLFLYLIRLRFERLHVAFSYHSYHSK